MAEVSITSAAEVDFTEALCWYAQHSQQAAENFESEFEQVLISIVADPHRFPKCDQRHQYCRMKRFPFQVIYRIDQDIITVIAVAHAKRKPGYWSDR